MDLADGCRRITLAFNGVFAQSIYCAKKLFFAISKRYATLENNFTKQHFKFNKKSTIKNYIYDVLRWHMKNIM